MSNATSEAKTDESDIHLDHQKGTTDTWTELCIRDLKILARISTVQLSTYRTWEQPPNKNLIPFYVPTKMLTTEKMGEWSLPL